MFAFGLGFGPWINRGSWEAIKMAENEYFLEKWRDRHAGSRSGTLMWLMGINFDGSLRK